MGPRNIEHCPMSETRDYSLGFNVSHLSPRFRPSFWRKQGKKLILRRGSDPNSHHTSDSEADLVRRELSRKKYPASATPGGRLDIDPRKPDKPAEFTAPDEASAIAWAKLLKEQGFLEE